VSGLIRLLGPPALEYDGQQPSRPRGRKAWAVLALLLLEERPTSRRRLADLLFDDAADPSSSVRWTLGELRRALGTTVRVGGDPVTLDLGEQWQSDVELVLARRWAGATAVSRLDGDLLEGMDIDGCAAFDSWLMVERRRLSVACSEVLLEAAHGKLDEGRVQEAAKLAARSVARNPLDQAAHALLIHCVARGGDRRAAERQEMATRLLFERELGTSPKLPPIPGRNVATPTLVSNRTRAAAASRLEIGKVALDAGAVESGLDHLRSAAHSAADADDPGLLGASLAALGGATVHAVACRDRSASFSLRRAIGLGRTGDARHTVVTALRELAFVDLCAGRRERCLERLDEAALIAEDVDRDLTAVLAVRGMCLIDGAHYAEALGALHSSVVTARRSDRQRQAAWSLSMIGRARLQRGELELARAALLESADIVEAMNWTAFRPWTETLVAEIDLREGRLDEAEAALSHAWHVGCALEDHVWMSVSARGLGLVDAAAGAERKSRTWLQRSVDAAAWAPDRYVWIEAFALEAFSDVATAYGWPDAGDLVERLWSRATSGGMPEFIARANLHRGHLGDRTATSVARACAREIDNPRLARLVDRPAGASFVAG
jgi:DNA-binding SARP family transcriptional activator